MTSRASLLTSVVLCALALALYGAAAFVPGAEGCDYPGRYTEDGPPVTITRPLWPPGTECSYVDPRSDSLVTVHEQWEWAPWVIGSLATAAGLFALNWWRRNRQQL